MNSIMITGTAGQDAETRATQTGKMLVRFSMAIYNGKDGQGEYKPSTWLQVVAFDNDLAQTVKKGDRVNISGRLTGTYGMIRTATNGKRGKSLQKRCFGNENNQNGC